MFRYEGITPITVPLNHWLTKIKIFWRKTKLWSDTESVKDYLNFGEVSQLAVDILKADGMLPISIGVFGNWGAGKSGYHEHSHENIR